MTNQWIRRAGAAGRLGVQRHLLHRRPLPAVLRRLPRQSGADVSVIKVTRAGSRPVRVPHRRDRAPRTPLPAAGVCFVRSVSDLRSARSQRAPRQGDPDTGYQQFDIQDSSGAGSETVDTDVPISGMPSAPQHRPPDHQRRRGRDGSRPSVRSSASSAPARRHRLSPLDGAPRRRATDFIHTLTPLGGHPDAVDVPSPWHHAGVVLQPVPIGGGARTRR